MPPIKFFNQCYLQEKYYFLDHSKVRNHFEKLNDFDSMNQQKHISTLFSWLLFCEKEMQKLLIKVNDHRYRNQSNHKLCITYFLILFLELPYSAIVLACFRYRILGIKYIERIRTVAQSYIVKREFLEISQNSQEFTKLSECLF